jgi:hypothetical protein
MDIGRSFTYITEDEEWWKKLLIGGLLSIIPFYGLGYMIVVLKNVIEGREVPLPVATEDIGGKFVKGLLAAVIVVVYMLPFIIFAACSGGGGAAFSGIVDDPDTASIITYVWSACFGCLALILGIIISLFAPFALSLYADTGQLGEAFKLGKIFAMLKSNIGPTIIVLLVSGLVASIASSVGPVICIIGVLVTRFYANLLNAFLFGSLYNKAKQAVV